MEFQPAADIGWQSWACNELNQAATYPSPFANVSKANMRTLSGSIGNDKNYTWQPYTMEIRQKHLNLVNAYVAGLPNSITEDTR